MKTTFFTTALAVLIGLLPATVMSANEHDAHAGHMANQTNAANESPMSEGVVKKVDKAAGKVTIAHGPLVNLKMPAMTMVFRVKEAAWIDQMQTDVKIRFLADTINGSLTIVRFELAK
jgi:Cu/Ag efflux protein CusF